MTEEERVRIVLATWDRESSTVTFIRNDGKGATLPMEGAPAASPQIARLQWSPLALTGVLVTTAAGDQFVIELPGADDDPSDRGGRPVVYLDQLHWSTFHKVEAHARVHSEDAVAATQIARWAEEGSIILPASSGHYHETTKWTNATGRYQLGVRILTLSRGWHMRHPLAVRREELRRVFLELRGSSPETQPPVITRDTEALLFGHELEKVEAPSDFPPDMARAYSLLTNATAMVAVMLDDEAIESTPPTGWSAAQQRYSDWLRDEARSASKKRASIDGMFLGDLRPEIAEEAMRAGLSPDEFTDWLVGGDWKPQVAAMPSLGLYRELYQQRHLAGGHWEANDLTDMVYLACGAAYADFAVGERHMSALLTQSLRRLHRPVNVYPKLRDVIGPLRERLDT